MNQGADQQRDTTFSMSCGTHLNPSHASAKLKKEQNQINHSKYQYDRKAPDAHSRILLSYSLTVTLATEGPLLP